MERAGRALIRALSARISQSPSYQSSLPSYTLLSTKQLRKPEYLASHPFAHHQANFTVLQLLRPTATACLRGNEYQSRQAKRDGLWLIFLWGIDDFFK